MTTAQKKSTSRGFRDTPADNTDTEAVAHRVAGGQRWPMFARARAVVGAVALLAVSAPVARADPVAPADFVVLQDVDPSIEADIR